MKSLMIIFLLCGSVAAGASTISQKRASEMAIILSSTAFQSLLQQEDLIGVFETISFLSSMTETPIYAIQFSSYSGPQPQACVVSVSISNANVTVGSPSCSVKAVVSPSNPNVCAHPSPVGCLDGHPNQPQ